VSCVPLVARYGMRLRRSEHPPPPIRPARTSRHVPAETGGWIWNARTAGLVATAHRTRVDGPDLDVDLARRGRGGPILIRPGRMLLSQMGPKNADGRSGDDSNPESVALCRPFPASRIAWIRGTVCIAALGALVAATSVSELAGPRRRFRQFAGVRAGECLATKPVACAPGIRAPHGQRACGLDAYSSG
jgi:hypothetical protein